MELTCVVAALEGVSLIKLLVSPALLTILSDRERLCNTSQAEDVGLEWLKHTAMELRRARRHKP